MKALDRYLQRVRIKKALKFIKDNSTILDIGSAEGLLFKKLGTKLKRGVGVDPILEKDLTGPNYALYKGLFPAACPTDVQYDAITMLAVLEHIPTAIQKEFAKNCYDQLKPKGRVIITVPSQRVDDILKILEKLRLIDGMSLEEHYGFDPTNTGSIFSPDMFTLIHHSKFQLGLNNLFVFEKIQGMTK